MPDEQHWYRARAAVQSRSPIFDLDGDFVRYVDALNVTVSVHYETFPVLRHTPKGVWLDTFIGKRFVLRDARKRFACPTPEEALESLKARNRRRCTILRAQLRDAEAAHEALNSGAFDENREHHTYLATNPADPLGLA